MSAPRYLIVGPSWVGDMVMAGGLFSVLKSERPDAIIDVVAPKWSGLVASRFAEVNQVFELDVKHGEWGWTKRKRMAKQLLPQDYTHSIVMPRSLKSALLPWFARIPVRTGFVAEARGFLLTDPRPLHRKKLDKMLTRYAALGLPQAVVNSGIDFDAIPRPELLIDPTLQQETIAALGLNLSRPIVGMMPGAEYGPSKQWPGQYFADLANRLVEQGYQVWVFGSDKEKELGQAIAYGNHIYNLVGHTNLLQAIDLLALCQAVVCNDSGLMHMAAAVGCEVHAVYGSTSPDFTPPLTPKHTIYQLEMPCRPCFKRVCPLGHTNCLNDILPEQIQIGVELEEQNPASAGFVEG